MMHAIRQTVFGGPEVLTYEELPMPIPQKGEALIRVQAAALNRVDLQMQRGLMSGTPLPRIPGIDCAGIIEAYAGDRTDLSVGTPVVVLGTTLGNGGAGAFATHVCVTEEEVFPLPAGLDTTAAACLGISYLTAWYALRERVEVAPWETLFLPGGGGVASAALQIALASSVRVLATSGSAAKCLQAQALGAEECFDYSALSDADIIDAIQRSTGGKGADFALNAIGGDVIPQIVGALGWRGTVLSIGIAYGTDYTFSGFALLNQELAVLGVNVAHHTPRERYAMFLKIAALIARGRLKVLIDRMFPLAQAAEAERALEAAAPFGKIVLLPEA